MVLSQGVPFPGASLTPYLDVLNGPAGDPSWNFGCRLINFPSSSLNMEGKRGDGENDDGDKLSVKLQGEPIWSLPAWKLPVSLIDQQLVWMFPPFDFFFVLLS